MPRRKTASFQGADCRIRKERGTSDNSAWEDLVLTAGCHLRFPRRNKLPVCPQKHATVGQVVLGWCHDDFIRRGASDFTGIFSERLARNIKRNRKRSERSFPLSPKDSIPPPFHDGGSREWKDFWPDSATMSLRNRLFRHRLRIKFIYVFGTELLCRSSVANRASLVCTIKSCSR